MKKVRKAIIPVAGLGTRMLPATKSVPKEMLPIVNKPTLQYLIEECVESGIEEIILITNSNKKCIEDHFDISYELEQRLLQSGKLKELEIVKEISDLANIYYIRQGEPKGSGHAINLAKPFIHDEYFAVLYGDDIMEYNEVPVLKQLIDKHYEVGGNVIGAEKMSKSALSKYNSLKFSDDNMNMVLEIVEKPSVEEAPSDYCSNGRYIINSTVFDEIYNVQTRGGEYYFADAMANLMKKENFYACHYNGKYYDTGNKLAWLKTNIVFALKDEEIKEDLKQFIKNLEI